MRSLAPRALGGVGWGCALVLARSVQAESAPPPLRLGGFAAKSRCLPHRGGGKRRTILRTLWYQCNFAIERPSALARTFTDSSLRVSALDRKSAVAGKSGAGSLNI